MRIGRVASTLAAVATMSALVMVVGRPRPVASRGDYLASELRSRVERLKTEAATPSTDLDVLAERLRTLWDWGNGYALTDGPLPPDLPTTVSRNHRVVLGLDGAGIGATPEGLSEMIAGLVAELTLKDEQPEAIGELRLLDRGPFRAGEEVTLRQVYTVGAKPMAVGGALVLGGRRLALQTNEPTGPSYVTVSSSNPRARFRQESNDGRFRGVHLNQGALVFRLEGAVLEPGETVTVIYGDRSRGGVGHPLQLHSNDSVVLPLFLDLDGMDTLVTPSWPAFEVTGREEVHYVNAVAPSILQVGEPFALAVRSEDRYKNLASGTAPSFQLRLNGRPFTNLPPGDPITVLEGLRILEPGIYRYTLHAADGRLSGRSNPIRVETQPQVRLYWGDLHGHTGFAEGQGSPEGYYRFGRDVARLDFVALSEHDIWMDDQEWRTLVRLAEEYVVPGRFSPLLGYEWTARNAVGGHHNVYFRTPQGRARIPLQSTTGLEELYRGLEASNDPRDVLVVPHAHQAGDWTTSEPRMERLAEITSGHGTFEFFGNRYLSNGFELGFVGASDNHVGHPGYTGTGNRQLGGLTAVVATLNTPADIFDALRDRATYATTGERILLEVTLNGMRMGQHVPQARTRRVECTVAGTAPIDAIDVIKNGTVVYSRRYLESAVEAETWVQVKLESSSEVFSRANPRGSRPWRGRIEIAGARLVEVAEPWFANPRSFRLERRPASPNRLDFELDTRGRGKGLLLHLSAASRESELRLFLDAGREGRPSPGADERPVADLPAAEMSFRLGDLESGPARRRLEVVRNVDAVEVQLVGTEPGLDRSFSYADFDPPQPGDYYYVRVAQVDGGMAWSSPFWIDVPEE